jgi:iron complex transport system permease protein
MRQKKFIFVGGLVLAVCVLSIASVLIGSIKFSLLEIIKGFWGSAGTVSIIVWQIRIPRILMAIFAGFGLAAAGAGMQAILKNPLASPFTLGVSAGAGLGAGFAIVMGFSLFAGQYFLIGNAFLFSLIPAFIIFGISRFRRATTGTMILAGIAMSYIFAAITHLLTYFSKIEELKVLSVWLMGDLGRASWVDLKFVGIILFISMFLLMYKSQAMNIMNAGDITAKGLGVNVDYTRIFVMIIASLITATIVCFTGLIGFVGLVAPHIARMIIGADNRFLIPISGLIGAIFLLSADIIAVKLIAPVVLPVGIITAFLGAPLFLYLIIRKRKREYW